MVRDPQRRIPIGISSCLLGHPVRYDGGHKRDACVIEELGALFEFLPLCPEVAIGMGTPRPPIRLTGEPSRPRAVAVQGGELDVTDKLIDYAHRVMTIHPRISGYIFKRGSPSCGLKQVAVYDASGTPHSESSGLYAGAILRSQPMMPVEEEDHLHDPFLRNSFVERVYAFHRRQRCALPANRTTNRM